MILNGGLSEFPPEEEGEGHVCALEGAFGVGVMICPQILFLHHVLAVADGGR